jgi:deoxyribose-phosphate aldolase
MVAAGASRIGASASVQIVRESVLHDAQEQAEMGSA